MQFSRGDQSVGSLLSLLLGGTRHAFSTRGIVVLGFVLAAGLTPCATVKSQVAGADYRDNGYFYRMTAKFEVKETGEPINFDFVVACNIRVTRWRDGGLSDDSTYTPHTMVKATADGHAVMVSALRKCSGLTSENGDVPPDVLPLAVWFDSVDDLSHGLGYVSEDAYDNKLSKLRFHGARIEKATRTDWEAWRKRAAAEYVQRGALPGPWGREQPQDRDPDVGQYAAICFGYMRAKLPEAIREKIRPLWPATRPHFWAPADRDDMKVDSFLRTDGWIDQFGNPTAESGMPLRSGREVSQAPHVAHQFPREAYPLIMPPLSSADPITVRRVVPADVHVQKLEFRHGALNGFAACQDHKDIVTVARDAVASAAQAKRHLFMVDSQVVRELPLKSETTATSPGDVLLLAPSVIFERDEYVFVRFDARL